MPWIYIHECIQQGIQVYATSFQVLNIVMTFTCLRLLLTIPTGNNKSSIPCLIGATSIRSGGGVGDAYTCKDVLHIIWLAVEMHKI